MSHRNTVVTDAIPSRVYCVVIVNVLFGIFVVRCSSSATQHVVDRKMWTESTAWTLFLFSVQNVRWPININAYVLYVHEMVRVAARSDGLLVRGDPTFPNVTKRQSVSQSLSRRVVIALGEQRVACERALCWAASRKNPPTTRKYASLERHVKCTQCTFNHLKARACLWCGPPPFLCQEHLDLDRLENEPEKTLKKVVENYIRLGNSAGQLVSYGERFRMHVPSFRCWQSSTKFYINLAFTIHSIRSVLIKIRNSIRVPAATLQRQNRSWNLLLAAILHFTYHTRTSLTTKAI